MNSFTLGLVGLFMIQSRPFYRVTNMINRGLKYILFGTIAISIASFALPPVGEASLAAAARRSAAKRILSHKQIVHISRAYHGTTRTAARGIQNKGFDITKMRASARFGKGSYVSLRPQTALKERPHAEALVRMKASNYFKAHSLDLSRPKPTQIKRITGRKDLRGTIHKRVIGPKLGHRLGRVAAQEGKVIKYRSARDPKGTNVFIPKDVYKKHPQIVGPYNVTEVPNGGR